MEQPPVVLRAFPLLSPRCAMREGGRRQRTQAKRRIRSLAALAQWPLAWAAPVSNNAHDAMCLRHG